MSYQNIIQVYRDYKRYSAAYGCKNICERHYLIVVPKHHKGYTCQAEGIKYCRRCAVHYSKEAGIRCPCCRQQLSSRIRSKQSKRYREQRILEKAQEEVYIKNIEL